MEPMKRPDQLQPEAILDICADLPRTLLVHPDPVERARLAGLLGPEWRIETADAAALPAAARRAPADVLLARVEGAAEQGAAFIRGLRRDPATQALPVVLIGGRDACLAGVEAGAEDFLIEPFDDRELLARLRRRARGSGAAPSAQLSRAAAGERRLQSFIDHAPVAVAMFDRKMRYVAASRRWVDDWPIILGRCHYDLFPDQPEHWRDAHARALAGETMTAEEDRFDQPDGTTRWFRWEVQPWRDADGAIGGVVVFYEEITERKQAEERMKLGAEVAGLGLIEVDYTQNLCRVSAEAAQLFGLGDAPMTATRDELHALVHPDDQAEMARRIEEALDPAGPGWFEMDLRIVRPGQATRWLRIRLRVRFSGEGKARRPVGSLLAALDVTAECSALEVARRSEEFTREVLDALPQHVAVLDSAGKIVAVNEPWRQYARDGGGLERRVSLGANYLDVCRAAAAGGDQAAQETLEGLEAVVHGARAAYEAEYPCHPPGGLRWFLMQAKRFARGGLVVSHSDVTQRRLVKEALRASEQLFRKIFEHAATGVAIADAQGRLQQCNPAFCALVGYAPERLVGKSFADLAHPDDRPAKLDELASLLRGASPVLQLETRYLRRDGGEVWVREFVSLLRDEEGRPSNIVALTTDVTARRRMEEALREADRRKDEFLATLAHELRNPLVPIRNAVHVLGKTIDKGSDVGALHAMMERQVKHLVRLVDDLMEVSRVTRGKIELRRARIDLSAAVAQALEISEAAIRAGGHKLAVTQAQEPLPLDADMVRLAQVFANLLNNAAKYTPRGGRIELSTRREGDEAVVTVRDTGVGIPPEMLPRVFDMFTQVEGAARRAPGGLGIGLALVRSLVELHGGRVEAQSAGPGKGSVFTVRLPLAADCCAATADVAQMRPTPLRGRRLLVVDDNRDVADSLGTLLRCLGAQVRVAYDGDSALELYDAFRPSAVLLDLGMPGMSGFEIAKRLRARVGDAVTLIAVTGWGQEDDRRRSREAGFDAHLVKPIDPEALQEELTRASGARA